jgi:PhnB protein
MPKRSLGNNGPNKNDPKKIDPKKIEQLNRAVDAMLSRADGKAPSLEAGVEPLLRIAAELRELPRENFKARLKTELIEGRRKMTTVAEPVASEPVAELVSGAAVRASATPRLAFKDTAKAIEFYKKALGAKEIMRFETGRGIPHADILIGDSTILLSDEWPEGGRLSAETLGYSPVQMSLDVDDVDSFAARAVAGGMKALGPIKDQFYGRREGSFVDPFGYTWNISTVKEEMSVEEMHRRMEKLTRGPEGGQMTPAVDPVRKGFKTVTPYIVTRNADSVIEFVKKTFGAEETERAVMPGGIHSEVRIEDSMLMIGGGVPGVEWKRDAQLGAFHVYVRDCDAAYERAMEAGGKSLQKPTDQPYGERSATVIDPAGNFWYIATFKETGYKSEGAPTVQPYLHPLRAVPLIDFLKRAFGAEELGIYASPDGVIHHATLQIGTSHLEMGEANGPYQPMKSMFYLYVPDADAAYRRALTAGATSLHEPADQFYGDRSAAVKDAFGNIWYVASNVKQIGS